MPTLNYDKSIKDIIYDDTNWIGYLKYMVSSTLKKMVSSILKKMGRSKIMKLLDVCIVKNVLEIELSTCDIPSMKYTEHVLRNILLNEFQGNVSEFLVQVGTRDTITFSFTADDYESLVNLLEQAQYTLIQARTIICWIDQAVAADSPDPSWGPIYCEILEGAH